MICDLCGQTYLTPADLDDHLRDMHQVIRKKLMFGSRGIQEGGRNSPLTAQDQNEQTGTGRGGVIVERDGNPRHLPQVPTLDLTDVNRFSFAFIVCRVPTRPGQTWKNESTPGKPGNIMEFCKI